MNVPGCLFSPLPPMGVRKITSPPGCVEKEKDTEEKWRVERFKLYSLALGA